MSQSKEVHVVNKSAQTFKHGVDVAVSREHPDGKQWHVLEPHADAVVPEFIAKLWMRFKAFGKDQVVLFNPKESKKRDEAAAAAQQEQAEANSKITELEGDNKSLIQKIADLQRYLDEARGAPPPKAPAPVKAAQVAKPATKAPAPVTGKH